MMTLKMMNKLVLVMVLAITVFSSCTKEDITIDTPETTIETETSAPRVDNTNTTTIDPLALEGINDISDMAEIGLKMTINNSTMVMDVVAAYCQDDDQEFLIVANKVENLTFPMQTQNFEEGDFVYFTSTSDGEAGTWGYGGQALGEDITEFPGLSILFSDAKILIDSNDGEIVSGSSEGTLYGFGPDGNPSLDYAYPYAMEFVANIIQESTFCE